MKTCKGCGKSKPLSDYYSHPDNKDGFFNKCKACITAARRKAYVPVKTTIKLGRSGKLPTKTRPHWCTKCGEVAFYMWGRKYACSVHRGWLVAVMKANEKR